MDHKSDTNQKEIVEALREAGASVLVLSQVGKGCPDLLIGYHGLNYLAEIEDPEGRGMKFTPAEKKFVDKWKGVVFVIESVETVLQLLNVEFVVDRSPARMG